MIEGEGDDDAEILDGTEGEGTEGQDPAGGHEESTLPPEHADEAEDDGQPEVKAGEEGEKQNRGSARIQRLAQEAKAAREDAAAARREAEELKRQSWQRQEQQSEAQQREMLALMTAEERAEWRVKQMEVKYDRDRQQDRMQTAALMDKTSYDAKATINPVYRQFQDEVESRFHDQVRQGRPVEREIILKVLLGERALAGAKSSGTVKRQAKQRVDSQRVAAGSGRSDAATERGRAGDTAEKRLKDTYI